MPVIFQALKVLHGAELIFYQVGPVQKLLFCTHLRPLEGGKGLWHKEGGACHDLDFAMALFFGYGVIIDLGDLFRQQGDALHILLLLCGQAQHKVQLYSIPASLKGLHGPLEDHFLCQSFVDHIPEPLGAGFRREGQAALFYILHLAHDIQGEGVNAQGRQGDIDLFCPAFLNEEIHQLRKMGVVAGA